MTGAKGFTIGISGGVDSTLVGKLAQLAVQELRAEGTEATFVAVQLPHGVQMDAADAQAAIDFIGPDEDYTVNIADAVMGVDKAIAESGYQQLSDFNRGNVKARMRMIVQYALAGDRHLLVLGSDHAAEAVTGFYTKFGDGGADLVPLAGLNKRQNQALLRELDSPQALWAKCPPRICSMISPSAPTRTNWACVTSRSMTTWRASRSTPPRPSCWNGATWCPGTSAPPRPPRPTPGGVPRTRASR